MPQNAKMPRGAFALYCLLLPPSGEARFVFCLCEHSEANSREGGKKHVILSVSEIPLSLYVILSVSEISHRTIATATTAKIRET